MKKIITIFMLVCAFVLLNATVVMAEKVTINIGDYGEVRGGYVKMESLATALGWVLEKSEINETGIRVSYSIPLRYELETYDGRMEPGSIGFSVIQNIERKYTESNLWYSNLETDDGFMWSFSDLSELPPYVDSEGSLWVPLELSLKGAGIYFDGDSTYQDLVYARNSGGYSGNIRLVKDEPITEKPVPVSAAALAHPTSATVIIDGKTVAFDAYNIGGNNYFKLRELAYALNSTKKQFEVGYDAATRVITLTTGKAYTSVGDELTGKGSEDKSALPTKSDIVVDGKAAAFTAYNIGGNNYFKLRDVGETFDFGVDWDGAKKTITIDTGKAYTPEL
ncbi:MAG: copper amine oxidase N-terminal domain-containing protein [Tannerellaceae bacterium]|nr:copper amine oxidase N-terminal domain-containing protein [Tannerellaceae bacterium]